MKKANYKGATRTVYETNLHTTLNKPIQNLSNRKKNESKITLNKAKFKHKLICDENAGML